MDGNGKQAGARPIWQPRVSFALRLALLFVALAVIMSLVGVRVWQSANRFVSDSGWVAHTHDVEEHTQAVLARLGQIQASGIAYAATGSIPRLADFHSQAPLLGSDLAMLAALVADNPEQVARVREFGRLVVARRDLLEQAVEARSRSGAIPVLPADGPDAAQRLARTILGDEDQLLVERRAATEHTAELTRWLTFVATILSTAFLAFAFWLIWREQRQRSLSQRALRQSHAELERVLADTQRMGESMRMLAEFGEMLHSCRTLDEVRDGVRGTLAALLPGLGGRLALINPSQNLVAIGAHWGEHGLIAESIFAPEDCWALRRGQPYPLTGVNSGFVCKHVHWPNPDLPEAGYLCVPLVAQGEMIGVLTFDGTRAPDVADRRLALAAGEQLALALANLRLQDTLRTQSIRDPLTGLFNRRYLEVSMERELVRATRRSASLAVLMLDVDHFKPFNDTYGHDAGDTVLAQVGEVLKRASRSEDIACRYGGEEFILILLDADADIARKRAEQIRLAVAALEVEHRRQRLGKVTLSIGVAVFSEDGKSVEELLRRADGALYQAKHEGRDRVVLATAVAQT